MTNTPLPNGLFETVEDQPVPASVYDDAPEARGMEEVTDEGPVDVLPQGTRCGIHGLPTHTGRCAACDGQDLPVERATFVLVPVEATEAYWEGYAYGCGFQVVDGRRYRIVATKRTGATGASDAQYIIDRMASGLHFAKLKADVDALIVVPVVDAKDWMPGQVPYRDRTVAPQVDPNRASPTGRDLERMEAAEWAGEDL